MVRFSKESYWQGQHPGVCGLEGADIRNGQPCRLQFTLNISRQAKKQAGCYE